MLACSLIIHSFMMYVCASAKKLTRRRADENKKSIYSTSVEYYELA